jgi:glycosyltransferase involved in cell wall biosynthesis
MRLLVAMPLAERLGGAENMLWTFLRHADRSRIVPAVVFFEHGRFEREVAGEGIQTFVVPAGRLRSPRSLARTIRSLSRLFRREQPDLLLSWMAKAHLYSAPAAALAGTPDRLAWWQHGVPSGHWLDRVATSLPARAVGCSSDVAARAQGQLRPHRATFVVHPGIDCPDLDDEHALEVRRLLGVSPETLLIGIVGRLQPWKGQHLFVRALAELRRRQKNVQGLVVGGNAYDLSPGFEEHVHRLVRQLGLTGDVFFTGQVEDARPYIAAMDVLVNASAPEPFGLVLVEAMALGVPVVAVALGGPAEIIEHERSGLLVPTNHPDVLADAIERLTDDRALRLRLGEGAQDRFRQHFTAEHMVESLQSTLERLGRRGRGARTPGGRP